MKRFNELTEAQQAKAIEKCAGELLSAICEGAVRFNDTADSDDLQKRIDTAFEKAEAMRTPWFAHEYIMDTCRDDIESMARATAEDALYSEPGENVVRGVAA